MEEIEAHQVTQPGLRSDPQKSVRDRKPVVKWLMIDPEVLAGEHT
jgi:hypothetical protein